MQSIWTFSQFITEEVEVIPPAQKAKLDADAATFAKKMEAELATKDPAPATTTPASTAASTAPAPVRTVPTLTDYNAAIGYFDALPLQNKTVDDLAAQAWLIVTRDKAQKPADYTKNIQILKTNFSKGEDSAQKLLAFHFKYPVDFLQQQSTTIAGSNYTGVNLQADQYTLGTAGKSANYSISFINPSRQAQVKQAKPAAGTVISAEGRSPDMSTASEIANGNWRTQTGQATEDTTTKTFKNPDGSFTVKITGKVK